MRREWRQRKKRRGERESRGWLGTCGERGGGGGRERGGERRQKGVWERIGSEREKGGLTVPFIASLPGCRKVNSWAEPRRNANALTRVDEARPQCFLAGDCQSRAVLHGVLEVWRS